jgi:Tol biopolymer transport system component/DNA-binding winged helix-turn-helix (wHTH) protein
MRSSRPPSSPLRFGPFEVDLAAAELLKRGRKVPLQDQPFKVLALLLQRPGELVTREELQKALWPADTFGEFDEGLNKAVQKLRQALDDSSDNPRFIETLPRKGYRFIAALESPEETAAPTLQPAPVQDSAVSSPSVGPAKRRRTEVLAWLLLGIVSLTLLVLASIRFWPIRSTSRPVLRLAPLTSYLGRQIQPALSPDGKQVAFAWDGERGDNFDIYVTLVNAGPPLRLTNNPAAELAPAWSPDGRYIAFCRILPGRVETLMIPALGGAERKLAESAWCGGPSWSPDGKFLALVDKSTPQAPLSIFLLSIETGDKRKITFPPSEYFGDFYPRFSPDGKNLAFMRDSDDNIHVLTVTDAGIPAGEPRRLIFDDRGIAGFDWTRDGRRIVYASAGGFGSVTGGLWAIRASGGTPERLSVAAENASGPSIAPKGDRLVYVREVSHHTIWQIPGPNSAEPNRAPSRLIASTRTDREPQFSRSGERIAFISIRSGNSQIWSCDREGHNEVQLTSFSGHTPGSPSWSPDERWIAFDSLGR